MQNPAPRYKVPFYLSIADMTVRVSLVMPPRERDHALLREMLGIEGRGNQDDETLKWVRACHGI